LVLNLLVSLKPFRSVEQVVNLDYLHEACIIRRIVLECEQFKTRTHKDLFQNQTATILLMAWKKFELSTAYLEFILKVNSNGGLMPRTFS
jgi:hypothetical protein